CFTSSAVPVVCGAAIEVPESTSGPLPVPMPADTMLTPGAVTSGFRPLSPVRGPPDEKLASARYVGLASVVAVIETVPPFAARSVAAAADVDGTVAPGTPRNGIVTWYWKPPKSGGPGASGSFVIVPSNGGNADELLTMITPAAPACWAKIAFATRAQTPRSTTITSPVTGPDAVSSATLQPRLMPFGPVSVEPSDASCAVGGMIFTGNEPLGMAAPFASIAVSDEPFEKLRFAAGNDCVGSFAAADSVSAAVPGEPVRYGTLPPLPDEETTITPSFAASVAAAALGLSVVPKGAPRDMLIASMWWSTAHSMPWMITASEAEPLQPNTRTE